MTAKSSGFTLIELLVVVAIIGILSGVGIIAYTGYISGTKQKSAENAMQQISLAQTEEYSNSGEYFTQAEGGTCTPDSTFSAAIETALFGGGDVISEESGYEMCIASVGSGSNYNVIASNDITTITMTANGNWSVEEEEESDSLEILEPRKKNYNTRNMETRFQTLAHNMALKI